MNDFEKRLVPGTEAEQEVLAMLQKRTSCKCVALNGTEHTHPDFVNMLRNNNSEAAMFVRYAPDGVMLHEDGRVIHYDVKAATSIEKNAWTVYTKYAAAGCTVILFLKHNCALYWQHIDRVRLLDGRESIEKYAPERRFPVDSDGWIHPRKSGRRVSSDRMSGTPFRYIDMSSMNFWSP